MIAPTRRAVLGGLASTVAMPAILTPAFAQNEWGESFDNQQANIQAVRTNRPVLNPQASVEAEWALQ
ncbi:unnamed protein product, partial [Scytosiphon promiscuus]